MSRWVSALAQLQRSGEITIAVTIVSTRGSVPRESGTRMLVTQEQVIGTIGGGHLEFKAIGIARDMLAGDEPASMRRFPLGASLGQCCGGLVNLLFEPVAASAAWVSELNDALARGKPCELVTSLKGNALAEQVVVRQECSGEKILPRLDSIDGADCFIETLVPSDFRVVLFGAGHVGRALVKILADLDCLITWVDSRENEFPSTVPDNVKIIVSDAPDEEVGNARPGSYFLVMTHSHPLDQVISEAILRRGDFAYFGLIGSLTKRRLFEKRLAARGIEAEQLAMMTCPIGKPSIQSKEPMAIAVSVAAELIWLDEQRNRMNHNSQTQALGRVSGQKWPVGRSSA